MSSTSTCLHYQHKGRQTEKPCLQGQGDQQWLLHPIAFVMRLTAAVAMLPIVLLLGLFLFSLLEADLPAVAAASQLIAASLLANLHLFAHGLNTGA